MHILKCDVMHLNTEYHHMSAQGKTLQSKHLVLNKTEPKIQIIWLILSLINKCQCYLNYTKMTRDIKYSLLYKYNKRKLSLHLATTTHHHLHHARAHQTSYKGNMLLITIFTIMGLIMFKLLIRHHCWKLI